jgi:tRNA (guanine37-N1)-methyltransferase
VRFDVLTLFPDLFTGFLNESLLKLAQQRKLIEVQRWNLRDWGHGRHKIVDDRPFGGGPGMVLLPGPVFAAVEAVQATGTEPGVLILLSPAGERLTQPIVAELSRCRRLVLLCGRYEGFDDRVRQGLQPRELSVGDYICNGGEVPAMIIIEAVSRLIPGVLGDAASAVDESHSSPGRLEYPHYTRPRSFRGMDVPEILLSGNHAAIARWRQQQSEQRSQAHAATAPREDHDHAEPFDATGGKQPS